MGRVMESHLFFYPEEEEEEEAGVGGHSRWYLQRSLLKVPISMSMGFSLLTALALVAIACKMKFDRVKR